MPEDSSPITPPPAPPFVPGITDPKYTQVVDEAQRAAVEAARQAANVQTVDAGRAQAKLLTGISKNTISNSKWRP